MRNTRDPNLCRSFWQLPTLLTLLVLGGVLTGAQADPPKKKSTEVLTGKVVLLPASRERLAGKQLEPDTGVTLTVPTFKPVVLREVAGEKATVLIFAGTHCPISNKYVPQLLALKNAYGAKGVRFVPVYSNAGTTQQEAQQHVGEYFKEANGVWDNNQALADLVGAKLTPEVAVLDSSFVLRYKGRIDNRYVEKAMPRTTGATRNDLKNALDAVLAGKGINNPTTPAVGCLIERSKTVAVAKPTKRTVPTYADDIAPLIQKNCQSCHRDGEIGPMPFETYEQVRKYAANIVSVTESKLMPPWKPVDGHGEFTNKRKLTTEQIALFKKWADSGTPSGELSNAPKNPEYPKGWQLGTPDLVLSMPAKWRVAPSGPDVYRCFVLPTNLTEDKEVVAVEYRAGNKRIVHHVIGFIDVNGEGRKKDEAEDGPGYTSFGGPGFMPFGEVGGWAPGNMPAFLPNGIGRKLPAGSDVVIQMHYHPNGQAEDDITQVGLYFAKKPIQKQLRIIPVVIRNLDIPAGDANHWVEATFPVPVDADVIFAVPHMHLLGRQIEMWATLPDGTVKPIIRIDDWDYQWQDNYFYKEPLHLPKGAKVTLKARYDNSEANPRNPNSPPKKVAWGEETTDEMCIGFLGFVPGNENDPVIKLLDSIRQRKDATSTQGTPNGPGAVLLRALSGEGQPPKQNP